MKIAVLVKQVPDTWSPRRLDPDTGWVDRDASPPVTDEIGDYAIEVALRAREAHGGQVVALTMGPESASEALRHALEMGCDEGILVVDDRLRGADLPLTSRVLAESLQRVEADLIIAGNTSTDGRAGLIPSMIAEHLGFPLLNSLDEVEVLVGEISGHREVEGGEERLRSTMPAVISVSERSGAPRVPGLRQVLQARKRPVHRLSLSDLGLEDAVALSSIVSVVERPPRTPGPRVPFSEDAVRALVDLLVDRRLI